jgi:type VI secretion system protein VasG
MAPSGAFHKTRAARPVTRYPRAFRTFLRSRFQEAHTISTHKGAPPGYVGYGEGGRLTEAVRRKPYSVILLDEIEKAHPDVHEIFFQVFDKGVMEDGTGRRIDFKNALIILTSNVGTDRIIALSADPDCRKNVEALVAAVRPFLLEVFPAALLGRIVTFLIFHCRQKCWATLCGCSSIAPARGSGRTAL